ncbi:MAG: redoxin domain-containing protein [Clostridia bacterium]|nr:redoxin domain-containing protein [Clostridia bacterium]
MRLEPGQTIPSFVLKDLSGEVHSDKSMLGKIYMLSFYRYASCPFCNLRVNDLIALHQHLNLKDHFIGVFHSDEKDLIKYMEKQNLAFPICSDSSMKYYEKFGVENSKKAYLKGAIQIVKLFKAFSKGYYISKAQGPKATVPADFIISEEGKILEAYYGKDISDHMPLHLVESYFRKYP